MNEFIQMSKALIQRQDTIDHLIERIDCFEGYEDYERDVSVFAGFTDNGELLLLRSINYEPTPYYSIHSKVINRTNQQVCVHSYSFY